MAAEDDSNFFSRWSRRKVQVRTGQPLPADPPVAPAPLATPPATPSNPAARAAAVPPAGAAVRASADPAAGQAQPAAETPAPLTLDDVAQLTPDGDFKPFMARQVPAEVRNAAVKKLFSDPHFNVMDGLDIYIDDYAKPSPLSAADMARMVSAQFLKLVDDPNEAKPAAVPVASAGTPVPATLQTQPATAKDQPAHAAPMAEPVAETDPPHTIALAPARDPTEAHDDHADLQLQPDHAPERESPGRGAG